MNRPILQLTLAAVASLGAAAETTTFEEPLVSGVPISLPVWSGFSPVVLQYGTGAVQDSLAATGLQSLEMAPDSAAAWAPDELSAPSGQVLVSSFHLRLDTLSSDAPVIPAETLSAVVFANTSGLWALDGNGSGGGTWQHLQALAEDSFHTVTVTRDYAAQTYDLEVDGSLVADNFGFKDPVVDGPFTATFQSSERAWLDDVDTTFTDLAPPTPDPMSFASLPAPAGATSVTMTATEASDPLSPVEYFFDCITAGGNDSGWQTGRAYLDTGLTTGVSYTYQVKARDSAGNETAISLPASATPEGDTSPPGIASLSPANGASGVAVNTDLVLTLNESVQKGTGSIRIKESLGNAIMATIDVTSASVMISGNVVTVVLPTDLGNGTTYYVEIEDDVLVDLSGNPFGGITGSANWSFTTTIGTQIVIYEPFDYTDAAAVVGQNGGTGFSGAWTGAGTFTNNIVGAGLSFSTLDVAGGSNLRSARDGLGSVSRTITAGAQTQLTANDSTIWFSVLMDPTGGNGFATNSYGTLIFGDTAYPTGNGTAAPANSGSAFGVGFADTSDNGGDFANMQIQGVAYDAGALSTSDKIVVGDVVSFIVGKIDFVADGSDDTLTLYNVTDPGLALPAAAFATISVDLDQSGFNVISIADGQTSIFDEIRFGTSFPDVVGDGTPTDDFEAYISNPIFGLDPSKQGVDLDPDGDRLANGLEAWFGTHPGESNAGITNLVTDGTVTTFTHPQNETPPADISGFYQWSPNLVDWYACDGVAGPPAGPSVTISLSTVGPTTTVTATASETLERLLLRVGVMQN